MTTLFSAMAGPLLLVCLVLIFGPCLVNKLITSVKSRVGAVQLMILRQQHRSVRNLERAEYESFCLK